MHDLEKEMAHCKQILRDLDIAFDEKATIEENSRAKRRWGQCRHRDWGNSININAILLDERVPVESLRKVILHELLHTVNGCQNHGYLWQRYAGYVNRAHGYEISRTDSEDSLNIPEELRKANTMQYRHVVICTGCGQEIKRMRQSNLTKHPEWYRCGKCGGVLVRKEDLEFKKEVAAYAACKQAPEGKIKLQEDENGQMRLF